MRDKHLKLLNGEEHHRLDFGQLVDRIFWALVCAILYYGVDQLRDLSKSVNTLNEKIAVVVSQVGSHEKRLDWLESAVNHR